MLRSHWLVASVGCWWVSAAIGCGGTSNDFFEGAGARSGGTGAVAGGAGTAGDSAAPRGGTGGSGGSSSGGESGARARGGDAGDSGGADAGAGGDGHAGATDPSGGASQGGQNGSAGGGQAGVGGDERNGGAAGEGGSASGAAGDSGAHAGGAAGDGGGASGAGGEAVTGGNAGDGGAHAGGRDNAAGGSGEGGVGADAGTGGTAAGGRETGGEGGRFSDCNETERCDGIDNDCSGRADDGGVCPESCRGFDLDGRAYMFCSAARGHFASAEICEDAAMDLVRIESARENAGVLAAAQRLGRNGPPGSIHLGATDFGSSNEGNFRWPDGAVFWIGTANGSAVNGAYQNWDRGEPNNYDTNEDCVEMLVAAQADKAGLWNDVRCRSALSFVCEE